MREERNRWRGRKRKMGDGGSDGSCEKEGDAKIGEERSRVSFPPFLTAIVVRRPNDVAISLRRDEVIASSFRSRIARKSSILDRRVSKRAMYPPSCLSQPGAPAFSFPLSRFSRGR